MNDVSILEDRSAPSRTVRLESKTRKNPATLLDVLSSFIQPGSFLFANAAPKTWLSTTGSCSPGRSSRAAGLVSLPPENGVPEAS